MPMYGIRKIARSQAIAVCGLRFWGTMITARTRITMSTTSAIVAKTELAKKLTMKETTGSGARRAQRKLTN
jgi:hypothetical protein